MLTDNRARGLPPCSITIMPSIKNEGDSDGDDDMSGAESQHSGSSRVPDRDSSGEDADEPDSDDSSEMDESECERRRSDCMDNLCKCTSPAAKLLHVTFNQLFNVMHPHFIAHLERQFSILREQLYCERINQVDTQLTEIRGGRSQEYLAPLQRLNENMRIRTEVAGILKQYRLENIRHKFLSEEQGASQHFEVSRSSAMCTVCEFKTKQKKKSVCRAKNVWPWT